MWIWWIVSLIVLIACVIFAYRMIISSYEFLPADKRLFFGFNRNSTASANFPDSPDALKILRNKVQHVEDNTTFYHIQFTKFQDRLNMIEEKYAKTHTKQEMALSTKISVEEEEEEDWKELYYDENAKKESMENELDFIRQQLEEAESKLKEYDAEKNEWKQLQSDFELRLHDLQSLQNNIMFLQGKLDASAEREKELEQVLLSEITMREKYSLLKKEYARLLSETDDLRNIIGQRHTK